MLKIRKLNPILIYIIPLLFTAISCNYGPKESSDTTTSGEVKIVVDESYALLFDTQIYTFESLYKQADIVALYKPESEALDYLIKDSCKIAVLNRNLNPAERKQFEANKIFPKSTKIAEDAIALIVNNDNTDTLLTIDQLKSILQGIDTSWKQINPQSALSQINVVFDNKGSANARYMLDSLMNRKNFPKNCFAVTSNSEVINYVNSHKNALGVISVNWISDRDDTLSQNFLKQIKVVGLSRSEGMKYYKPYQAYIKTKDYPLCRDVFMINRQTRAGLGTGFVSFVAGDKGQRIILKSGLVPAIAPVRIINVQ